MKISEVASGTKVYVDANIFIYHFGATSQDSSCTDFLAKIQKGEINGVCSILTIIEVSHRLMILEAVEKYKFKPREAVKKLKERPDLVEALYKHSECIERIYQMGLDILPVHADDTLESAFIRKEFGLLTNDSVSLVIMNNHGISDIATNDSDFERIDNLKVWKP
jgi:predicted nucleic acid-binding protein